MSSFAWQDDLEYYSSTDNVNKNPIAISIAPAQFNDSYEGLRSFSSSGQQHVWKCFRHSAEYIKTNIWCYSSSQKRF